MAGDGNLKDNSLCCTELRECLTQANTAKLAEYVEHCLSTAFSKSGLVFQDLVNELGRRLDYKVLNGRYQGTVNSIGFDGVWLSPEGHTIVAEVKTTDAYRIPLDTIASYRQRLVENKEVTEPSSILILVGRQDTGELEAQIRGSRHAWDIRVINADSLIRLVELKEDSDDPETGGKIRSLLTPMEFTRLDGLVDVMFTTAKDVEAGVIEKAAEKSEDAPSSEPKDTQTAPSGWVFTDAAVLDAKRPEVIDALAKKLGTKFIKKAERYIGTLHTISGSHAPFRSDTREEDTLIGTPTILNGTIFLAPDRAWMHGSAARLRNSIRSIAEEFIGPQHHNDGAQYWHIHLVEKGKRLNRASVTKDFATAFN